MGIPGAHGETTIPWKPGREAVAEPFLEPLAAEIRAMAAQAAATATYIRLWEAYLHLGRRICHSPLVSRMAGDPLPHDPGCILSGENRRRMAGAIADLVIVGMAKGELRSGLDTKRVADRFLQLCIRDGRSLSAAPGRAATATFDRFWNGIAAFRNSRQRTSN